MIKKPILFAFICLLTMPAWAQNEFALNNTQSFPLSLQETQSLDQTTLFASSLQQKRHSIDEWIYEDGISRGYVFSPVYQMSFNMLVWYKFFYIGIDGGFNFGKKTYESLRSVEDYFNPLSYTRGSLGFKLGPLMVGCGIGYTWNTTKAHWLYNFGVLPGLVASAFGRILDASPNFFNGVYFMWGPEAHLQLGPVMLTCGYHMYPNLDMNHLFFGIGINQNENDFKSRYSSY